MNRYSLHTRILLVATVLVALAPLARVAADYAEVGRVLSGQRTERGNDWVTWTEDDGLITAAHVFHTSGDGSSIQEGDLFYRLDYRQYFKLEDLQAAIESIPLGSTRTYSVLRGPDLEEVQVDVRISRYPAFLYPLTPMLWHFSVWGFVVGTFLHLIGLVIAVPLVHRSKPARFTLVLIVVSALWIVGNLLRLVMVSVAPPTQVGSTIDRVFQALTFVGLVGWIGFPALLLHKVLRDRERLIGLGVGRWLFLLYVPAVTLGSLALLTTIKGNVGPLTLGGLIGPILFHACCYLGTAAAHALYLHLRHGHAAKTHIRGWPRLGSAVMLTVAILLGLSVLGVAPLFGVVTDTTAGWVIVSAQLLSIVPVVLVSLTALQYGNIGSVLRRSLTYLTTVGLIFFAFVGGMAIVEPFLDRIGASTTVAAGIYVVVLLIIFERLAMRIRNYAALFFATDRQQARNKLSRFQEHMRSILDIETLARDTIETVSRAFQIRSGHLFLLPSGPAGPWIDVPFSPEPPYLTDRDVRIVWPHFQEEGTIWARRPELNESTLPVHLGHVLRESKVSLAVPIRGDRTALGILLLGPKKDRLSVYNLEDLDMLRGLGGQLALAIDRLNFLERERALMRETAEAQLSALRAQINPHFLFNALNTILALIEDRSAEAEEAVEHLASIFRYTLRTGGCEFVPLSEEWALVGHYLGIEEARFGTRLEIRRHLDEELAALPVPAFAVQTLVENAIKHGLEKRRGRGTLRIEGRAIDDTIAEIVVSDTGVGIAALFGRSECDPRHSGFYGIGLRNVSARLYRLYDRDDLLCLQSDPDQGTTARLFIPMQPSGASRRANSAMVESHD